MCMCVFVCIFLSFVRGCTCWYEVKYYIYIYIYTHTVVNIPSVVNTASGVSVSARQYRNILINYNTLMLHVEYKYVYIHTYSLVNIPSVVNTGSGVSVCARQ